jgi:hypothetical protein
MALHGRVSCADAKQCMHRQFWGENSAEIIAVVIAIIRIS